MPKATTPATIRFWAKVDKTGDCWLWTGARDGGDGYGRFRVSKTPNLNVRAHRFAYEEIVGPVPDGLVLDHLCRNRQCVNPTHLEPVDNRTNVLRGVGPTAVNARKTHCSKRGHELPPSPNRGPWRQCLPCKAEDDRESYRRSALRRSA